MKRIFAILLALCMVFTLAACGSPSNGGGANKPDESQLKGKAENGVYENAYLNLSIALPENWIFYDEEQMAQVNGMTAELFGEGNVADAIDKSGQFMDMMMGNAQGSSVNLLIRKMETALALFTDEQIFDNVKDEMKKQFEDVGFTVEKIETITMKVGGEDRAVCHMVLNGGYTVDEYQIWYRPKNAKYMGILTLALMGGDEPQQYLDGFKALN